MPFYCPQCKNPGSLEISLSLELPADSRSDEITLQIVACSSCNFRGLAVYEESRRGVMDQDEFEHTGYYTVATGQAELFELMSSCPEPWNVHCQCQAHRTLGSHGPTGRWQGLQQLEQAASFMMVLQVAG